MTISSILLPNDTKYTEYQKGVVVKVISGEVLRSLAIRTFKAVIMSIIPPVEGEYLLDGIRFPRPFPKEAVEKIQASSFRKDDIFISSFPKSGLHWIQDIISLVLHSNDIDGAMEKPYYERAPMVDSKIPGHPIPCDHFDDMPSPRLFSSHVRYNIYKDNIEKSQCRVIVLLRNPKDVMVSFYHFHRAAKALGGFKGSWEEFFKHRMTEEGFFGNWFDHVLGYWLPNKDNPNFLFVKYEDFQSDCIKQIKSIALFLDKDITDDQAQKIAKVCSFGERKKALDASFQKMKGFDQTLSSFCRKGKVGDWKNYFTVAQNEHFDKLFEEKMKNTGLNLGFDSKL